MMKRNFDYFKYSLPDQPVQTYIDNAITILTDIQAKYPQFYKHFICPSEVLTLSGVRAFDTYYDLGKDATVEEVTGLKELLKQHDVMLLEEVFAVCNDWNKDNRYSLIHMPSIFEIPKDYGHLPGSGWTPPNLAAVDDGADFSIWWTAWKDSIMYRSDLDETMKGWIKHDHWAAHNITFGMLLGYPGEALCSILYQSEEDSDNGNICQAKIKYGDTELFDGAWPIYDYLKEVEDNPHIKAHEQLWSDILTGVYAKLEPNVIEAGTAQ